MRTIKRYIPVFLLCMIIFLVADNYEEVIRFFDNAETNLTKQLDDITSNGYLVTESELSGLEDSGITGSNYSFDTKYYPYYDLLTVEGQIIYKQIYANMENLAPVFVPIINLSKDEMQIVMEAVYNDHPELFWINTTYSYKYIENDIVVQITLDYNETANNIELAKEKFSAITDKIIQEANTYPTNYEKEKYVHDELLKRISYDTNAPMNQSAYSALVNKKTVCAGYARAFQYIMMELGIPTYYISGYSNQNHAWNIINLDGEYYNVDLTWNDSSNNSYQFFNLTDNEFSKTHTRNALSMKLPSCNANKYKYIPENSNETPNLTDSNTNENSNNEDIFEKKEKNTTETESNIDIQHQYHSSEHHIDENHNIHYEYEY